jgi:hypothetical protein
VVGPEAERAPVGPHDDRHAQRRGIERQLLRDVQRQRDVQQAGRRGLEVLQQAMDHGPVPVAHDRDVDGAGVHGVRRIYHETAGGPAVA